MNDLSEVMMLIGGFYHLGFTIFHLTFWRLFRWKKDLSQLTFINRSVMQILNLCLTFVFLVISYVSFFHAPELIQTPLGHVLLVGFSLFWFFRTIEQVIFFKIKNVISFILTFIFLFGSILYIIPLI